jgi:RHS repeat-associated protein
MLRSGATSYYHADGLGSVSSLSNVAGSIANSYTYDSFGKLTNSTGSLVNPFRYTARESDTETGLYYYRARYYDQSAGRFVSEDPIHFLGGINFYEYALNNPTTFTDPMGLCQFPSRDCIGLLKQCNDEANRRYDDLDADARRRAAKRNFDCRIKYPTTDPLKGNRLLRECLAKSLDQLEKDLADALKNLKKDRQHCFFFTYLPCLLFRGGG